MRTRYVCGFFFDAANHVLLIRKARPAWQAGKLNGVGGKIEAGETPAEAMVREFHEECGLVTAESDWRHYATLDGGFGEVLFFSGRGDASGAQSMTDEQVVLIDAMALPENVVWNARWLIPMALDARISEPVVVRDAA